VGADIANSIRFFSELYGPYPYDRIFATEVPFGHGISYPGFLHLSYITFQIASPDASAERFRAHEVAHQWWGSTVNFATYHDQWISEGFSEYSALWYVQWILGDSKRFYKTLDAWRDAIFDNRKYRFGSGQEAGPISLGYRTQSSETAGDYDLVVYLKGAWVLHMLRNLFIDLNTLNEDAFKKMMRDFYQTYRHKAASTKDFQDIVEKHAGMDMEWFFAQWVYGTEVPTYRFSYKTRKSPDGKFIAHCKVKQEGGSEGFKMYVLVTIDFGENRMARMRVLVDKLETEFDLPPLPHKPKNVIFNDFHSVLARVKKG